MNQPAAYDAVAIGEGQLRLTSPIGLPLVQTRELAVNVSGTEGNAMSLLARLGNSTALVTALPDTPLGRRVVSEYVEAGVDVSRVLWRQDGRVALYFVDTAVAPIASQVYFDRRDSVFSQLTLADIDWSFLQGTRLFHATGITAALTDALYEVVATGMRRATAAGSAVSFDVNFRSRLWSPEQARRRLEPLLELSNVIFCSRRDAATVLGIDHEGERTAAVMAERYGAQAVIVSDGAGPVHVAADGDRLSLQPPATQIVDRVGAGDAMIGAFLHGYLADDLELGLRLAVAASALALTRQGDQVHTNLPGLTELAQNLGQSEIVR